MTKILFLYSELAAYTVNCLNKAVELNPKLEIHVVRWAINKEAPFEFDFGEGIHIYEKNDYSKNELIELAVTTNPNMILCSGWMDKDYLSIVKLYFRKISTILTLDNHWRGDFKQQIASIISPFWLKKIFTHCWVPGKKQEKFSQKLDFDEANIKLGWYSADVDLFHSYYQNSKNSKIQNFPKVFLYVGRYVKHKGIFDMWNAFVELQNEQPNDWELWCVGTGEEYENRIEHTKIKHFGFKQPNEMGKIIKQSGVYILPSHFEPWGVTLHEFAAAGFPLICSDNVGAAEVFMQEGANGYVFKNSVESIKKSMKSIVGLFQNDLIEMQNKSVDLSQKITPQKWVETLMSFTS